MEYLSENGIDLTEVKKQKETMEKFFKTLLVESEPPVGVTPKEVVWKKNKAKLYRYKSDSKKYKTPVLFIYALINKPYILDLTPNDSIIEHLVANGHDVYLLDWGIPDYEDRELRIENYIHDYIHRAVKAVLKTSKASDLSLFGYCMGGTFSAMYTSLYSSTMPIRNLILLTTPLDFSSGGLFSNLLDERYFNLDKLVDTVGLIPGEFIDIGSRLLSPYESYVGAYENLYKQIEANKSTLKWKLMQKWTNDSIPLAGETYRQWIREFYQHNKLVNDELLLNGDPVRLGNIKADTLFIAGEHDNIVLKHQITNGLEKFKNSKKKLLSVPGGHVSAIIGAKAKEHTYPHLIDWLDSRSK